MDLAKKDTFGTYKSSNFHVLKIKDGNDKLPSIILIYGFTSERYSKFEQELESINETQYMDRNVYVVKWESKTKTELGLTSVAVGFVGKVIAGGIGEVIGTLVGANSVWKTAKYNAWLMANDLSVHLANQNKEVILIGHSLGARAIYYTLLFLSNGYPEKKVVKDVFLLGGAVHNYYSAWEDIHKAVSGKIYNYHSSYDSILANCYGGSDVDIPIGGPSGIPDVKKVKNFKLRIDHFSYFKQLGNILNDVYNR